MNAISILRCISSGLVFIAFSLKLLFIAGIITSGLNSRSVHRIAVIYFLLRNYLENMMDKNRKRFS